MKKDINNLNDNATEEKSYGDKPSGFFGAQGSGLYYRVISLILILGGLFIAPRAILGCLDMMVGKNAHTDQEVFLSFELVLCGISLLAAGVIGISNNQMRGKEGTCIAFGYIPFGINAAILALSLTILSDNYVMIVSAASVVLSVLYLIGAYLNKKSIGVEKKHTPGMFLKVSSVMLTVAGALVVVYGLVNIVTSLNDGFKTTSPLMSFLPLICGIVALTTGSVGRQKSNKLNLCIGFGVVSLLFALLDCIAILNLPSVLVIVILAFALLTSILYLVGAFLNKKAMRK